ncbi:hypothetical protein CASFOL_020011 [Castilleja foliolosa]|uniref:DUF674 domain-containing protein n=1 Tax=Castilleja foliolosa TaxID=1961234 RepID=A0ABD3D2D3_9LAMI
MSDPRNVKFPLKVVLNKQKTKVLYAEANSEFTDVLLSFLTLPLGTIVRVLQKHDPSFSFGSIATLYKGLASLDSVHFRTEGFKQMLLNPRTSSEVARHKLKLNIDDTDEPTKYYRCASPDCCFDDYLYVSIYRGMITCDCGKSTLSKEIKFDKDSISRFADDGFSGVYTTSHFIISDDLQIFPSVTGNVIRFLSNMGITDMDDQTELMDVTLGFKEIMDLLKGSLLSDILLSDIVLKKRRVESFALKYELGTLVPSNLKSLTFYSIASVVKAIIQKSTNKLIYVEGDDKFVEFLFSLLTIPLGGIEHLLGGSTKLKFVDNLYRTLRETNGDMYLKKGWTKYMLLNPKLPLGYTTSDSQLLPLNEEDPLDMCFKEGYLSIAYSTDNLVGFKSPKGRRNYVKGTSMYMVTDDLVVTHLCTTSCFSTLNLLKVPLSDVREMELKIGLKEALRILAASLTSTRCLSDGLSDLLLEKQSKQEQRV